MKKTLSILLALCLLCGMLPMALAEGGVSGTFEGESTGFHGPVKVSVTLDNGAITDVTVTEQAETLRQIRFRFSAGVHQAARVCGLTYDQAARLLDTA